MAHIYNMLVDENTRDLLIDLNRTFYQTFAQEFSATRQRLQPGVRRLLDKISYLENILDLGCGNGQLGKALLDRGHEGLYTGLDSNPRLLEIAREILPDQGNIHLLQEDLTDDGWDLRLPVYHYNIVLAFAVLHHIPGFDFRKHILIHVAAHIPQDAIFIHSEWQFLNSPRLRERIQPWEQIGLATEDVEDGDYLIDWRSGGYGLRYVHLFEIEELDDLAAQTGFEITESFLSDGEGGDLGIYQVWKRL